jgi:hypothetical protein
LCFICFDGEGVCNAPKPPELELMLPATAENDLPRSSTRSGPLLPAAGLHNTGPGIVMDATNQQSAAEAAEAAEAVAAAAAETKRQDARLVSPCACRGSSAYVHPGCLKAWHAQQTLPVNHCPTCEQPYQGDVALSLARLGLQRVRALHQERTPAGIMCEAMAMDAVGQLLSAEGKHNEAMDLYQHSLVSKVAVQGTEVSLERESALRSRRAVTGCAAQGMRAGEGELTHRMRGWVRGRRRRPSLTHWITSRRHSASRVTTRMRSH